MTKEAAFSYDRGTFLDRFLYHWRTRAVRPYIISNSVICDFGCGRECLFLKSVANKIKHGIGIDFAAGNFLAEKNLEFCPADLNRPLPLNDESFDMITSLAVVEHLDQPNLFFTEAYRILKKDGQLVLTTPAPQTKIVLDMLNFMHLVNHDEVLDHKQYFNGCSLKKMAKMAGFSRVAVKRFQFSFNIIMIAKK